MAEKLQCLSHKLVHLLAEKTDSEGKFIPYSIRALTKDGELIEHDAVVHVPIKKGNLQSARDQKRGLRRFKILSSNQIRQVYSCLIIEINGTRISTGINGKIQHG